MKSGQLDLPVGCINNLIANWKVGGRAVAANTGSACVSADKVKISGIQASSGSIFQSGASQKHSRVPLIN